MKNGKVSNDKIAMAKNISKALNDKKSIDSAVSGLSGEQISKLKKFLNNEEAIKKIMESDEAKTLLKKYGEE